MVALALGACACQPVEPFEPTPSSEIQPGAGLFSGPEGRFVIYDGMAYCSDPRSPLCQRTEEDEFTPKN